MSLLVRLIWGTLAGIALLGVKVLGPDQPMVRSFFEPTALTADILFYLLISLVTVGLATISGAFSEEQNRVKLLLFCASMPALLSTATAQKREVPKDIKIEATVIEQPVSTSTFNWRIFSPAYAQISGHSFDCEEGNLAARVARSASNYLTGADQTQFSQYSVVVRSITDFEVAKKVAEGLARSSPAFEISVGCRRPGNTYFPIMVGPALPLSDALALLGKYSEAENPEVRPYISAYPYRVPIYRPEPE